MSEDHYESTKVVSTGNSVTDSLKNIVFGIVLFCASVPLLWWNEGRSINRTRVIHQAEQIIISTESEAIDPTKNGKLVHFFGKTSTPRILKDSLFGIEVNALKLQRIVEMYQWKEEISKERNENEKKETIEKNTHNYTKVWDSQLIPSDSFEYKENHINPPSKPIQDEISIATPINVGAFTLSEGYIDKLDKFTEISLSSDNFQKMNPSLQRRFHLTEKYYGNSIEPDNPKIGDVRVRFQVVLPYDVSVMGKQTGNSISAYPIENDRIELLSPGSLSGDEMFQEAHHENYLLKWGLRFAGFLCAWIGLALILSPLSLMLQSIPFIGSLLESGITLVSFLLSLTLSITTIAVAWMFYRPLIGGSVLLIGLFLFFSGYRVIRKMSAK